jgi:hypothetical protein
VTRAELRDRIGGLLEQHLTLAEGVGGLISPDSAQAIASLASAYADLDPSPDEDT